MTGLHIIGEVKTVNNFALTDLPAVSKAIEGFIDGAGLTRLGTIKHSFDGGGFTLLIALAESHLSVHTWPELNYLTLDVFACNELHDNSDKAREIFAKTVDLFGSTNVTKREIER